LRNGYLISILILLVFTSCQKNSPGKEENGRFVMGQILTSEKLPKIKIALDDSFVYQGKIDFKIRDIAIGERYIFIDSENHIVKRMFIAQFEGFLPSSEEFYRYSFVNATEMGNHKFRQNTYAFSNSESMAANPVGEAALTFNFLKDKGFKVEDELMMSRFVTVAGKDKKHELILFYVENVSESGHRLENFYEDDSETQIWQDISKYLTERSLQIFEIIE